MNGLDIVVQGNFGGDFVGFAPVVTRGLRDVRFPRLSAARALKNWLTDAGDGAVVGAPTYLDESILCAGNANYLQSTHPETDAMTQIAVMRTASSVASGALSPVIAGTFNTGVSGFRFAITTAPDGAGYLGVQRYHDVAGTPTLQTLSNVLITAANLNVWRCAAVVLDNDGGSFLSQVFDLSTGSEGILRTTTNPVLKGGDLRYGSAYSTYGGQLEIAALLDYDVALTPDELTAQHAQLQMFFAEETVPILI